MSFRLYSYNKVAGTVDNKFLFTMPNIFFRYLSMRTYSGSRMCTAHKVIQNAILYKKLRPLMLVEYTKLAS